MKRLKQLIKQEGIMRVASDLGYSTHVTIKRWIDKNKIPNCAKENLERLLRSKHENNKREN